MSEASYKSFNDSLSQFLLDLSQTFDEYEELSNANDTLNALLAIDPTVKLPLEKFFEVFSGHSTEIMSKDSSLFETCTIPYTDGFDIAKEYRDSEEVTQNAIWGYLQKLFALATTVKMLPAGMMSQIESVANSCMKNVQSGQVTQEQAQSPAYILQMLNENPELMSSIQKHAEQIESNQ